jgi:ankyrin repeat protein
VSYAAGSLWTPLHLAAARGNAELCETLIAKGSPVGAKNVDGLTPADVAESRGHAAVAERLRRK